ncbi:hypothetical protein H0H81_008894 [Sphagnurus paluster]|uniref:Uncharacterized protein n=1 Tax=Sphagnurus paluster TaxID=117069 RepID=A0A9P7FQ95_9AGAR|nr:hypothetical protein H0H81_008894 [Sphagnurus paluster]
MENLRRRIPFKSDDFEEDENHILDEQEQEAIIQKLRDTNRVSSKRYQAILQVIFGLSVVLNLFGATILPDIRAKSADIPLPALFTLFNILVHLNLALIAFRDNARVRLVASEYALHPIPYQLSYAVTAVPPTLSMFLRRSWQSTTWWGLTMGVVFTVQTVTKSIDEGNESISELESLRYVAPGA